MGGMRRVGRIGRALLCGRHVFPVMGAAGQ
jgi:hypothetical protein